jgi:cellulose synthase/poly-beta-1,6-N-acetylglucosamine synthase-like glycosyltransferase
VKGSENMGIASISVVIPTYYRSNDLAELFGSILKQTIMPLEVIVVDDTPTNEIRALCEDYGVKFKLLNIELIHVKNPKERSITIARNIGAKMAKGDIIMFFDSDVFLYPDYMENILDVFQNYPNALGVQGWDYIRKPNKNLLTTSIEIIFDQIRFVKEEQCKYNQYPTALTRIINCEHLEGANMSFKRQVMEEFQFDENLKKYTWMEDTLFGFSVRKRYPNSLYMTPYAKYIHKWSPEGRVEAKELKKLKRIYGQYVLTKVFGFKGAFLFFKQEMGRLILEILEKVSSLLKRYRKTKKLHGETYKS